MSIINKFGYFKVNTSNIINLTNMFSKCSSLEKLDLHNFNTSKAGKMSFMFNGCSSLKRLDFHDVDAPNFFNILNLKFAFQIPLQVFQLLAVVINRLW